jgi:uncharacterized protein DUF998
MAEQRIATRPMSSNASAKPVSEDRSAVRTSLLLCGILSSLLYVAMNVFIPIQWEGYSSASQTISELSAIGAPTRPLWVALGIVYTLVMAAFGWGVWTSAYENRSLRVVGGVMIAYGVIGLFWPPMHLRGAELTLTDTMHIVFSIVTVLLTMLAIGFGAATRCTARWRDSPRRLVRLRWLAPRSALERRFQVGHNACQVLADRRSNTRTMPGLVKRNGVR